MSRFMSHRFIGLLAIAALTAFGSHAQTVPTKLANPVAINKELQRTGSVHVIVYMTSDEEARDLQRQVASRVERAAAKVTIRNRVDPVVREYFPSSRSSRGSDVKLFGLLPAFAGDISTAELKRLQADPRVHKIQIDELKTTNLDSSVPLIGLTSGSIANADAEPTGNGRTIAVIDTGVQANHPFIGSSRVLAEACFLTTAKCPNGTTSQTGAGAARPATGQSHGTHVSGIALGHYATGASVFRGVASKANLVMVNVFGSQSGAYTSDIIRALEFIDGLKTSGAGVYTTPVPTIDSVNMSLGGSNYASNCDGDPEKAAIDSLRSHGVVTVIAAGNDGSTTTMSSPGCISTAVSVAATSKTAKQISSYSNLSDVTTLFAPGGESGSCIISSVPGSTYTSMCGTSMATPHVAGIVALLRQAKPSASVNEIIAAMTSNMGLVQDTRYGGTFSKPFVDVPTAIANLQNLTFTTLTVSGLGAGSGVVTSTPGGMTCQSGDCVGSFVAGSTVKLTAVPDAQSSFATWNIPDSGCTSSTTCIWTVPNSGSVAGSATFDSALVGLGNALDNDVLTFSSLDTGNWFGLAIPSKSSDNSDAARSAIITDNQKSSVTTSVTGPGTLTFWWSVSSEANYDYLRFYVDGVEQAGSITGSVPYTFKSYAIGCGSHTLTWSYTKDVSVSVGDDGGYLDQVDFTSSGFCPATQTLAVTLNNTSWGKVTSTPAGISCGSGSTSCSASFATGTVVSLTTAPAKRRKFVSWSGACSGTSKTCNVTMSAGQSVSATFK